MIYQHKKTVPQLFLETLAKGLVEVLAKIVGVSGKVSGS
jgi:hypothetical protein